MSPPVSSSARLQSIMPAPVRSRRSLTASAVIAMSRGAPVVCGRAVRPRAGGRCRGAARSRRRVGRTGGRVRASRRPRRVSSAAGSASGVPPSALGAPGSRSSSSVSGSNDSVPPAASCGDEVGGRASRRTPAPRRRRRLLDLGSRRGARRALAGALDRRVGDELAEQPDRADRVVVGRDDVVELVGVDVRVARADDRDLELVRLGHGDPLAVRVDDEDRARERASSCGCRRASPGAC